MCRWIAYSGSPVNLEDLLYKPERSLVMQSKHAQLGAEAINGDGFGIGWYSKLPRPGLFHSTDPAWNNMNLRELSALAWSGRVFAHIRASTGTPVQETNCHPFRYDNWLWMHNGAINGFSAIKRDMTLDVDPELFPLIQGSTDSELFFYLALSYGLVKDPPAAVARAVHRIEELGRNHGIEHPLQMTVAVTDGETTWAFRYSTEGRSRSLFRSTEVSAFRALHPEHELLQKLSDDAILVVSEPLGSLEGAWLEVPESSCLVVHGASAEVTPFSPAA